MGSAAEDLKLVAQGEDFQEQILPGFEPSKDETECKDHPTDHALRIRQDCQETQQFRGVWNFCQRRRENGLAR